MKTFNYTENHSHDHFQIDVFVRSIFLLARSDLIQLIGVKKLFGSESLKKIREKGGFTESRNHLRIATENRFALVMEVSEGLTDVYNPEDHRGPFYTLGNTTLFPFPTPFFAPFRLLGNPISELRELEMEVWKNSPGPDRSIG